ncbi:MAG TPA: hypothetical protein PKD05_19765, partial [Candidatus Melainabacteria bacterium]|nr:hypothetical protein [Candidatus Melainabacteria bacterium]
VLKTPQGIQGGTKLIMKDMGVPILNYPNRRGDQVVHVNVETPKKLSKEEKELFQKLASIRGEKLEVETREEKPTTEKEKSSESENNTKKETKNETKEEKHHDKHNDSFLDKIVDAFRPKNDE